jgi:hypothetical protein
VSDDEKYPRGLGSERAPSRSTNAPTIRPPPLALVAPASPPRPNRRAQPPRIAESDRPTPRRIATRDLHVEAPLPDDRPTPRSTVVPRLPGPYVPMRPRLETLIFHGAPPLAPPSPPPLPAPNLSPLLPPTLPRGDAFQDVESLDLLEDDESEDAVLPAPYRNGESARTVRPPASVRPPLPVVPRQPRRSRALGIAVALASASAIVVLFVSARPPPPSSAALSRTPAPPPTTTAAPSLAAKGGGACVLDGGPHLLARRALVRGGVEATSLDDRLAFAALTSARSGTAFELDAKTLAVKSSAKVVTADPVRHIVPEIGDGAPVEAQVDTGPFRTLADAEGDSAVGVRDGFVVWGPRDGEGMVRLWRLPWPQVVEAPRVAALGTEGERVMALRRGGGIWVGSFRGGQTTSDLVKLSTSAYVGVPALDTRADEAVVAWAQRDTAASPWGVRWARWTPQSGAGTVHELTLPPGGPGDRAMAPSVSALEGRRVLLAWTEAGHGKNQVRAQVFDGADRALGDALGVSPDDTVAGQEQIALAEGGRGAIAYLVARRGAFELRATAIDCAVH